MRAFALHNGIRNHSSPPDLVLLKPISSRVFSGIVLVGRLAVDRCAYRRTRRAATLPSHEVGSFASQGIYILPRSFCGSFAEICRDRRFSLQNDQQQHVLRRFAETTKPHKSRAFSFLVRGGFSPPNLNHYVLIRRHYLFDRGVSLISGCFSFC